MILFNVGDSYTSTVNWCQRQEDHYWYKIGQQLGATELYNDSVPKRSNDAIIKTVMHHCLANPDLDTLYMINITVIFRMDITREYTNSLHNILNKTAIAELDHETIECSLYAHLIGLMEFLKARNKKFLIVNNSKPFTSDPLPMRDPYVEYFKQEPRVLNWFNNSRTQFHETVSKIKPVDFDQYGWDGHDGAEGHRAYFEMLSARINAI